MGAARQGLGNPVMGEASEACMLVRRQDQQLRGVGCQLLEEGARCIVCDGADAFDLDAQFCDIVFRTAFRQDPPASEERPDAREILEVFSLDRRVDVHHRQLSLHEDGELDGMGERRRVCSGEISRMKNPAKWKHKYVFRFFIASEPASAIVHAWLQDRTSRASRMPPALLRERLFAGCLATPRGYRAMSH